MATSSSSSVAFHHIPLKHLPKSHSFGQVSLPYTRNFRVSSSPSISTNYYTTSIIPTTTTASTSTIPLSNFWREIQGCNNWENLLDPLHPLLQREIIRYGHFVTACYKAFDLDPTSKRYLNCKYGKTRMLREIGMPDCGYKVVKYIYATPDVTTTPSCGRWIGFVAVSTDEMTQRLGRRDIVITFRGTVTWQEWVANLMSSLTPAEVDPQNPRADVKVEEGFLSLYTSDETTTSRFGMGSCREQVLSEIWRLLREYKEEKNLSLTMTGHSLGSALAMLVAYDVAELGLNKNIPVTVFSFGGPRVGNLGFKKRCEELGVKVLRIANVNDPVTKLPGVFFNYDNFRVSNCYAHVGVELALDFFSLQNPSCVHDLDSYIKSLLQYHHHSKTSTNTNNNSQNSRLFEMSSDLVEKGRHMLFTTHHNMNVLPDLFAATGNRHAVSTDFITSWANELLFGLVLLFL